MLQWLAAAHDGALPPKDLNDLLFDNRYRFMSVHPERT